MAFHNDAETLGGWKTHVNGFASLKMRHATPNDTAGQQGFGRQDLESGKENGVEMKSVLRAFEVLEAVSEQQPVSVGELARRLGLAKSTAQRNLRTLEQAGWLRQDPQETARWVVTARALAVRPHDLDDGDLLARARVPMQQLRDRTDETVHLSVPDGHGGMVLVSRVDCDQVVRTIYPIGSTSPMHCTSTGLAIMPYLTEDAIQAHIDRGLTRLSPRTITSDKALRHEIAINSKRGYSTNIGMNRPGVGSIGAPVFGRHHIPIAGLCISMPEHRFVPERVDEWGQHVRRAADEISGQTAD